MGLATRHLRTLMMLQKNPRKYGFSSFFGGSASALINRASFNKLFMDNYIEANTYTSNQGPYRLTKKGNELLKLWAKYKQINYDGKSFMTPPVTKFYDLWN